MKRNHSLLVVTLVLTLCALPSASDAAGGPVRAACAPLSPDDARAAEQVCSALDERPGFEIVDDRDVWETARGHGVDRDALAARYSRFKHGEPVRSTLEALGVEAVLFVEAPKKGKHRVVSIGPDGKKGSFFVTLSDGSVAKESAMSVRYGRGKLNDAVEKFRASGGWEGTVTASELQGLSADEKTALKIRKTARCFRLSLKRTWYFCRPESIGANGFVFGQKGKPFRFVRAGSSFVGGVHLGNFREAGFERERGKTSSPDFDPWTESGAPALLVSHDQTRGALACGESTKMLEPLSRKASRALLDKVTIRFAPARRSAHLKKTESGEIVWVETITHGSGARDTRVYVGEPPRLRERAIVDSRMYKDGGTRVFELEGGARLFLPANMWFMSPSDAVDSKDEPEKVMPDGSTVPAAAKFAGDGFRWATFRATKDGPEQKLYVVDAADEKKIRAAVKDPPPIDDDAARTGVCATVLPSAKK